MSGVLSGLLASASVLCLPSASMALSELQGNEKVAEQPAASPATPAPAAPKEPAAKEPTAKEPTAKEPTAKEPGAKQPAAPEATPSTAQPNLSNPKETNKITATDTKHAAIEVMYDITKAPEAVRKMREKLMEAASSGEPEKLRALLSEGADPTALALGSDNGDPIATIKSVSGDPDGIEVLAIMMDVLNAGFVHVNAGTPDDAYVWPYFAEKPLNTLTLREKVELLRIVTAGDYENMLDAGNYNFFRIGISPDGKWKFFTAGD
ncbi:hypothetical protein [Rhizobium oryziradicis]|uniref:Uncharacterized protein n=1 Tax=Rhizobium oryziradicis TaxID=1867956 RepID=A0A1Q8ZPQ2_9HYPH|nr:hypothetical protein [Rhizobium oryziradicis]OLP43746.1 hypothetical protein BJF95_19335 [Rhizobium oryziradicis]